MPGNALPGSDSPSRIQQQLLLRQPLLTGFRGNDSHQDPEKGMSMLDINESTQTSHEESSTHGVQSHLSECEDSHDCDSEQTELHLAAAAASFDPGASSHNEAHHRYGGKGRSRKGTSGSTGAGPSGGTGHRGLGSSSIIKRKPRLPGMTQGIDVKRHQDPVFDHLSHDLKARVKITVVDYAANKVEVHPGMQNEDLASFLSIPRPSWSRVRWINLQGLSWDCILALALRFDLHPLSVEDCVHVPQRIKADFHGNSSIFCCLTMASVVVETRQEAAPTGAPTGRKAPTTQSKAPPATVVETRAPQLRRLSSARVRGVMEPLPTATKQPLPHVIPPEQDDSAWSVDKEDSPTACARNSYRRLRNRPPQQQVATGGALPTSRSGSGTGFGQGMSRGGGSNAKPVGPDSGARSALPAHTLGAGMVTGLEIAAEQVYIFLMQDGTVISMFEQDGSAVCQPILQQVLEQRTLARESEDASYLLNLLVDATVDMSYPLVDAYTERLHTYEDMVLLGQVAASFTRDLHVMRGDLASLRRTILPTSSLIAALQAHSKLDTEGLITRLTKTYLGDVQDHLNTILEDMEGLQVQCQALSDLVFNLIAHNQNKAMQTLSVVSIIFLPITFLAGVYGANFDYLPEIHWTYGYLYFWCACISSAAIFVLILWRCGVINSGP